jgi:NADPH:quinone reductase-like Zn-dependent oxidoreductase
MALDTTIAQYDAPEKDLYEVGEIPPMGYVPKQMYAWAIRRERHGDPDKAMLQEVVDVPELDSQDVLVLVMAAGVNYNGVWAALGQPISPFDGHKQPYHIAGSDAAGIVWASTATKTMVMTRNVTVVIRCIPQPNGFGVTRHLMAHSANSRASSRNSLCRAPST